MPNEVPPPLSFKGLATFVRPSGEPGLPLLPDCNEVPLSFTRVSANWGAGTEPITLCRQWSPRL